MIQVKHTFVDNLVRVDVGAYQYDSRVRGIVARSMKFQGWTKILPLVFIPSEEYLQARIETETDPIELEKLHEELSHTGAPYRPGDHEIWGPS